MTLKALIASDVDDVFLQFDDFAETVRRYIGGDSGNVQTITAIVTWQDTVTEQDSRGKAYIRRADMLVNDSVNITPADAFLIGTDRRMQVDSVEDKDDGSRIVHLYARDSETKGVRRAGDV